jgi:hypothetical protein
MNTEKDWEEMVMAYFEVLSQHSHQEAGENHKNQNQDSR